jgi:outer membrane biosynthesis protein TonB
LLANELAYSYPVAETKPKLTLFPVLVVLFIISYALMVLLVTEQGKTIMSQRVVIQQLLVDSTELSHIKTKALQDKRAQAQAEAQAKPKKAIPSIQVPPQTQSKANNARPMQEHPPKPASDAQDARRRVFSI